jgi:hypothetical protein
MSITVSVHLSRSSLNNSHNEARPVGCCFKLKNEDKGFCLYSFVLRPLVYGGFSNGASTFKKRRNKNMCVQDYEELG